MPVYSTIYGNTATGGTSTIIYSTILSVSHGGLDAFGINTAPSAFTSGTVIFSGSNISLSTSVNGVSQYIQMTAGVGAGAAIRGSGSYTQNTGTVQFINSNGLTFGLETNGIMTASHNGYSATSQLSGTFLTTAMASENTSLFQYTSATSDITSNALNTSQSSLFQHTSETSLITSNALDETLSTQFAGTGTTGTNVTMTLNSNGLALSVDAPGGGVALQGSGTYTQNTGTVQFVNSNSMTFGLTNNEMTASFSYTQSTHEHPYINTSQSSLFEQTSATSAITSNALNTSQSSLFQHTSATSAITSAAFNTSQSSLLQHTSATSAITSNAVNTSITSQWLTTAALSDHSHGGITINGTNISASSTSASSGLTLNLSVADPSAAEEHNYITLYGNTSNASTASGSSILLSAGDNVTLAASNGSIKIEAGGGGGGTSIVPGDYLSSTLDGSTLSISVTGLQATSATSLITSNALNTSQSSLFEHTSHTSAITSLAVNTSITSQWLTTAAQSNQVVNSINASTGQISFATASSLSASSNGSTITFGLASNITTALQSAGAYLTTAANSTHSHGSVNITTKTGTNISISSASSGWSLSHPVFITNALTTAALSNHSHGVSASGGSSAFQTLNFTNSNGITFSNTNASIRITHALQYTSNTSAITANALNTSQSSLFRHTSADSQLQFTSAMSNYLGTAATGSLLFTSQSSLFQHTSATSAITASAMNTSERVNYFYTSNNTFANSTHTHGDISIAGTNISATTSSVSSGMTLSLSVADPGAAEEYNYITLYGNTSNASTASGSSILLSAGNNITLAASNGSIKIEGAAGGGGVAIADSASTVTNNTIVFSNSNGVSFGINGSTMTASVPVGTVYFNDSNGLLFGSSVSSVSTTITGSITQSYLLSGNTSGTTQFTAGPNLTLVGSDNITIKADSDGKIAFIGGAGAGGTSIVPGDYLSSSLDGSTLSLSVTGLQATSATSAITSNALNTSQSSVFVLTASSSLLQHTSATSAITASAMNTSERVNYFYTSNNTFANSTHSHGNPTLALTNLSGTTASASDGLTLSLSAAAPGAAEEYNYITLYGNTSSASTASGSSIHLYGSDNITLAANNGTIIIQGDTVAAPNASIIFTNTNGVSFITSTDGSTTTVSASVETAYLMAAYSTKFPQVWEISGNTDGTSSHDHFVSSSILRLYGGANITLSGGDTGISIIGGAGGGGVAIEDGAATITNGTAYLSDSNGISFGINGSTITASHNAYSASSQLTATFDLLANTTNYAGVGETTAGAISLTVNTAGVNASVPAVGYLSLVNSAGYTWSTSTDGVSTAIWLVLA